MPHQTDCDDRQLSLRSGHATKWPHEDAARRTRASFCHACAWAYGGRHHRIKGQAVRAAGRRAHKVLRAEGNPDDRQRE
eukprot:5893524-Alexandrium_andersonii.AAC.1